MKKIYILTIILIGFMTVSCSDFLDKKPLTKPNSETFLSSGDAVNDYINGLYKDLPSIGTYNMGERAVEKNSDNIVAEIYDKRLNGELQESIGGVEEWTKGSKNLRNVNFFFSNYRVSESRETEDIISMKGEAYFLRAFWHFYLLRNFGDIPIMTKLLDENATIEGLQIPRTNRTEAAEQILDDLEKAIEYLYPRNKYKGLRICKEAALVMAMRVALYEGSWEKYHAGTEFGVKDSKSEEFFKNVISYGDRLFQMGISIETKAHGKKPVNIEDAYASLFNSKDLSGVGEVLFWKKFSITGGLTHNLSAYLGAGNVDNEGSAGLSASLINNYLQADGNFIDLEDDRFKDFNGTFINRDGRMLATVMHSNCKFKSTTISKKMLVKEFEEEDKTNTCVPYLNASGGQRNLTGYHIRMSIDSSYVDGQSETAMPFIRTAEALLSYAEAAEELGICTDAVLEKTLKPLRERAGVTYIKPTNVDPNFTDYGYELTPIMQEIRRERRSELALQGYRLDDILRWRGHNVICGKRGTGAYFDKDCLLYKAFDPKYETVLKDIPTSNGWIDPVKNLLPKGYQFNKDRDYLLPIPPSELAMDKKLEQNPGWM